MRAARWCLMATPDLPGAPFDGIVASLVLFFVPDPVAALRAWREQMRTDGRVVIGTFGERPAMVRQIDDLFRPYVPAEMLDARTVGTRGPFATDTGVEVMFEEAGFGDVPTRHATVPLRFSDPEEWQRWSRSHGQAAMWRMVPDDKFEPLVAAASRIMLEATGGSWPVTAHNDIRITIARL